MTTATALAPTAAPGDLRAPAPATWLVGGIAAVSLAIFGATANPLAAAAPLLAVALGYGLLRAPLRWTLVAVLALAVFADIAPRDPHGDGVSSWRSVATPLQDLLLDNLNKLTGVGALRVAGLELALVACAALACARTLAGSAVDRRGWTRGAWPMAAALAVSFAAVAWLELWGVARGGDARQSLWQFRQLAWLPLIAALFAYALRGARDLPFLLGAVTATACAKVSVGAYYYFVAARGAAERPAAVTSHADTVLFVVVLALWAAAACERPTRAQLAGAAAVWGWILLGVVINNRRTAFVTLLACLALLFALLPRRAQRRTLTAGLALVPLLALYAAAGRYKSGGVFAPAASLWSVSKQTDGSSITRDIENFNLVVTLRQHPLAGSGWGHEYVELVKADDISKFFPQYRYVAHNSVLWLLGIGGLAGFTALWLPLVVSTFLAARAHAFARTPRARVGAYGALATTVAYLIQAWADMGVVSWTTTALLAAAFAVAGKLAAETGAWPAGVRLAGPRTAVRLGTPVGTP